MYRSFVVVAVSLIHAVIAAASETTIEFKFEKHYGSTTEQALERRQAGALYSLLSNELVFYQINVTVGTPAQQIGLQIDTGSSDIWLPDANGTLCKTSRGGCSLGSYNSHQSSTFTKLNYPPFQIAYVDGTKISGLYFTDVMAISGVNVRNVTMAAAGSGGRGFGIMGIGFRAGESSGSPLRATPFTYPNILDSLKSHGLVDRLSYSLWLDDLQSNTGSILFGGVDTAEYHEPLISLPIQRQAENRGYTPMTVAWTGLSIHNSGPAYTIDYSPSTPQAAILDSGTTFTYLPNDIARQLFNAFGVTTDPAAGNLAPCRLGANNITLTFQFGGAAGPVVNVPLSEFLLVPYDQSSSVGTAGVYRSATLRLTATGTVAFTAQGQATLSGRSSRTGTSVMASASASTSTGTTLRSVARRIDADVAALILACVAVPGIGTLML